MYLLKSAKYLALEVFILYKNSTKINIKQLNINLFTKQIQNYKSSKSFFVITSGTSNKRFLLV